MSVSNELIEHIAKKFSTKNITLATAESCTGGMIAEWCTQLAGSSKWYKGGVVSYANELKQKLLQVPEQVLAEEGAVSLSCVKYMALGALKACASQCALASSGVAGPSGGSKDKPVGTVFLAVALPTIFCIQNHPIVEELHLPNQEKISLYAQRYHFEGGRQQIRELSSLTAFNILLELLID